METVFTASTHDYILFFTSLGRVYRKKGYQIPEAGRHARGVNIVNIIPVEAGEKVSAMIHTRELNEDRYLFMATRMGTVKRLPAATLKNIRNNGIRALHLDEGDELISVRETDGSHSILLATREGMAIHFVETDVRPMGRDAVGVRGIRLKPGDYVVGAARAWPEGSLLTITENGYGKRTAIGEYPLQNRGGMGLKNYNLTKKTGSIVDVKVVTGQEDILLISDDGTMIRMASEDVSTYSRSTQGVRLMRLGEGIKVISLARAEKEEEVSCPDEPLDEG